MERGEDLLIHGLYRHGPNVLIATGLQEALGIRAVGLVAPDVGTDVVRRQKHDSVAQRLDLASPVVCGSARFHDHGRCRLLRHEGQKLAARQPFPPDHVAGSVRDRQLKNSLCHVDGDASIVRHDGLLLSSKPAATLALDAD
jgi:hypothetical protein